MQDTCFGEHESIIKLCFADFEFCYVTMLPIKRPELTKIWEFTFCLPLITGKLLRLWISVPDSLLRYFSVDKRTDKADWLTKWDFCPVKQRMKNSPSVTLISKFAVTHQHQWIENPRTHPCVHRWHIYMLIQKHTKRYWTHTYCTCRDLVCQALSQGDLVNRLAGTDGLS